MSPKALAAALLAIAVLAPQAEAFQMTKKAIRNQGIFGIKVNKTDMAFYGRADAILSISFQEYTTGSFIVAEVVPEIMLFTLFSTAASWLGTGRRVAWAGSRPRFWELASLARFTRLATSSVPGGRAA